MNNKFYMQKFSNGVWEGPLNIEDTFDSIVLRVEGLSSKGEIKNVYAESFAESEKLNMWFPKVATREPTDIVVVLGFRGERRRDNYDEFCEFISGCRLKYWDDVRNREAEMYLSESVNPDDDFIVGDDPYIVAKFKFVNINGNTKVKI